MPSPPRCPQCGQPTPDLAPHGLCPQCLLAAGLPEGAATADAPHAAPPAVSELAPLFPQLDIEALLGAGGMGVVYLARQRNLDRRVALKILREDLTRDPAFADRFAREARALARLNHPHIVTIYDFGEAQRQPGGQTLYYLVMEYVEGANVRHLLASGRCTPLEALNVIPQICDALQYAHDQGVVHRDIKPENILLDAQGRVKIADFGLAKLAPRSPADATLTEPQQVMGTPRYMAPEQLAGAHGVDHRADIYSLGAVFYEMLTGDVPAGRFEPPSHRVRVDVRLDDVVLRALDRDPQRRYQRAGEVKSDVERLGTTPHAPSHAPHITSVATLPAARLSIGALSGVVLAAAGVVCALLAALGFFNDPAPTDEPILWLAFVGLLLGGAGTLLGVVAAYRIRESRGALAGWAVAGCAMAAFPLALADAAVAGMALGVVDAATEVVGSTRWALAAALATAVVLPANVWLARRWLAIGPVAPAMGAKS